LQDLQAAAAGALEQRLNQPLAEQEKLDSRGAESNRAGGRSRGAAGEGEALTVREKWVRKDF
jgi:hypothetical protein